MGKVEGGWGWGWGWGRGKGEGEGGWGRGKGDGEGVVGGKEDVEGEGEREEGVVWGSRFLVLLPPRPLGLKGTRVSLWPTAPSPLVSCLRLSLARRAW